MGPRAPAAGDAPPAVAAAAATASPSPELKCLQSPPLVANTDGREKPGLGGGDTSSAAQMLQQRSQRLHVATPGRCRPAAATLGTARDVAAAKWRAAAGGGGGDGCGAGVEADGQGAGLWSPYSPRSDVSTEVSRSFACCLHGCCGAKQQQQQQVADERITRLSPKNIFIFFIVVAIVYKYCVPVVLLLLLLLSTSRVESRTRGRRASLETRRKVPGRSARARGS